jgi:hypothetical protein
MVGLRWPDTVANQFWGVSPLRRMGGGLDGVGGMVVMDGLRRHYGSEGSISYDGLAFVKPHTPTPFNQGLRDLLHRFCRVFRRYFLPALCGLTK